MLILFHVGIFMANIAVALFTGHSHDCRKAVLAPLLAAGK